MNIETRTVPEREVRLAPDTLPFLYLYGLWEIKSIAAFLSKGKIPTAYKRPFSRGTGPCGSGRRKDSGLVMEQAGDRITNELTIR